MTKNLSVLTKIRHRNELNPTFSSLPISAKRVLFLALSQINPREELTPDQYFYVTVDDYMKWVDIDDKSAAYKVLKEGAKILKGSDLNLSPKEILELAKEMKLPFNEKNIPDDGFDLGFCEFAGYHKKEGRVSLAFTSRAAIYLTKLVGSEKYYTTQVLLSTLRLSSINSSTLYQLIRKLYSYNKNKCYFDITINDLKEELGLYEIKEDNQKSYKYPNYPIFKRDVLNKSIKEITEKTEIKKIEFDVIEKVGRAASKLRIKFLIDDNTGSSIDDFIE
ncbi:Replication initiation protein [Yersinia enterocolitica]|uniref:RepB family plasmid replication initiator protein n=1 Tax=Proteus terrae subsp. cibarius TaxID=626774 RepID=A0ABX6JT02_9GAMM|nr:MULTISPECIES: replication initiation protein [Enterobacterales]MBU5964440.1 replication initiation protein [Proteus mirabilis]QGW05289.1 replication initiation protein [Proteus terrae subsp. cibarius]QHD96437.1 RepB family plasmid replication initiator protein [Proteus terrae subsp. cibarius]QIF92322.1 RepB family plasmid replication initiator protein [Proteus terrae subsp. cibarius]QJW53107.1 replication initiation protein [Proteus terrae subsp. cibarius]